MTDDSVSAVAGTELADFFEESPQATLLYDPETSSVVDANTAASELLGVSRDRITAEGLHVLTVEDAGYPRERIEDVVENALGEGETTVDWVIERAEGERQRVKLKLATLSLHNTEYVTVFITTVETQRYERDLERLADVTDNLFYAEKPRDVGELTLTIAADVLSRPFSGLWEYDTADESLRPLFATTEALDSLGATDPRSALPVLEPGTIEMEAFRNDDIRVIEDYQSLPNERKAYPGAPIRTVIIARIGEYGSLHIGSPVVDPPTDTERNLLRVLTRHAEAAIDSARREQELIEYRDQLERKAKQMRFFNGILRHDMLNGMEIVRHRAEILAMDLDGEHNEHAETIRTWTENIIELTDKVRSVLETLTSDDEPDLYPVSVREVVTTEAERVRQIDDAVSVDVDVPADLDVRATDLLAEVVGNLLTNAVDHNDSDSPSVTVAASQAADTETATIRVADDGPGIPEDKRERLLQQGETGMRSGGTGFGLYFIASMVEVYGGTISIGDSDLGGRRIIKKLPTPEPETTGGLSLD